MIVLQIWMVFCGLHYFSETGKKLGKNYEIQDDNYFISFQDQVSILCSIMEALPGGGEGCYIDGGGSQGF